MLEYLRLESDDPKAAVIELKLAKLFKLLLLLLSEEADPVEDFEEVSEDFLNERFKGVWSSNTGAGLLLLSEAFALKFIPLQLVPESLESLPCGVLEP